SRVKSREGTSGFMRFLTVDHGAWLARIGFSAKARMYTIGNPLIARTMLEQDIAAGLNVPVRLMIYEAAVSRTTRLGIDFPFSLRPSRAKQLSRDGLRIISPHGDAVLTPKLITAEEIDTPYDVVFLSVKAYALEAAMNDFAAAVGPETMIFPVLNGMRHVDFLTKRFGEHSVIGGVCLVVAEIDDAGRIVQLADIQRLAYGERNGEITPRLQTLDATLQGAGFDAHISTDVTQAMWEKWVQLASLGAITCLVRGA